MANNRMYICAVDDDGKIVDMVKLARHSGGEWHFYGDVEWIDKLFHDAFLNGHGIALTDEYNDDRPLKIVYTYNNEVDTDG